LHATATQTLKRALFFPPFLRLKQRCPCQYNDKVATNLEVGVAKVSQSKTVFPVIKLFLFQFLSHMSM